MKKSARIVQNGNPPTPFILFLLPFSPCLYPAYYMQVQMCHLSSDYMSKWEPCHLNTHIHTYINRYIYIYIYVKQRWKFTDIERYPFRGSFYRSITHLDYYIFLLSMGLGWSFVQSLDWFGGGGWIIILDRNWHN